MQTKNEADHNILAEVAAYYAARLAEYGSTARGVDWNGEESQELRFAQLSKVISSPGAFSVNDLGCGYGALYDYLQAGHREVSYSGCDISGEMIEVARRRAGAHSRAKFYVSAQPSEVADYGIASGIFNVRLDLEDAQWHEHLQQTLDVLDRTSRLGFAFNCLTSYSDQDKMRDYLYYANPCILFDMCKRRYSRHVALLHDYGLYEFTILVRKQP
jgi:SAM-dependent methyltransferase